MAGSANAGGAVAAEPGTPARKLEGARILVFDVNETLLDLAPMKAPFAQAFGTPDALKAWFTQLLQYSNLATLTGVYHPFGQLGIAAAQTLARQRGVALDPPAIEALVAQIRALPPHPDVVAGLEALRAAGLRMVALTNSSPDAADAQLRHAGLHGFFERVFTVEAVRLFKPHPAVYRATAEALGVATADLRMVAAHGWDVAGAMAVGCAGAFVARPGQELYPLAPPPDVVADDLEAVAARIVALERQG